MKFIKNHKKKLFILSIYLLFAISMCLFSYTAAKYISYGKAGGSMEVGQLYLGYERGDLFRNDILIVGVEVTENGTERVETMNVKPNDVLSYFFTVSNYQATRDELTNEIIEITEQNNVSAKYKMTIYAELLLPVVIDPNTGTAMKVTLPCQVMKLTNAETGTYSVVDLAEEYDLVAFSESDLNTYYSQTYRIKIEDTQQIHNLTSEDYFGSSLRIYIKIEATQVEPTVRA